MHNPGARVVSDPGQSQPTVRGEHGGIAAGRVDGGERVGGVVVGAVAGAEYPKVVAVQVDGVGLGKVGLDDHEDPLIGVGQGPDVLGGGPARVALADGQDGRVVPLGDERDVVHGPLDAGAEGQAGLLVVLGSHGAHVDGDIRDQVS